MVRPVILYGAECWVVGQKEEQLLETTEMRMLRRIRGVTLEDKMRSDDIRKELGVCPIGEKARESRLRWFWACYEKRARKPPEADAELGSPREKTKRQTERKMA
ncbi:hypothetical protein PoB_004093900 [Plakobranchus ocellatus]|uniref:Uncharacterized protein n=1 Tax=Plakobranchus ocellatus TaxID=259542 RepID=A0AAV4B319_9GAST|nr:hypothetical protein PoB_004093900 [Plakobranchus ocellatus]